MDQDAEEIWATDYPLLNKRLNPYDLPEEKIKAAIEAGLIAADQNSIPETIQIPVGLLEKVFRNSKDQNYNVFSAGLLDAMGKNHSSSSNVHGLSLRGVVTEEGNVTSFATVGCLSCHTGQLFGKNIVGLNNRLENVSSGFNTAQFLLQNLTVLEAIRSDFGEWEWSILREYRDRVFSVKAAPSHFPGLEPTGFTVLGASLKKKELPERDVAALAAFAKPVAWWLSKYKTRWLVDGVIESGNPVLANLIATEMSYNSQMQGVGSWVESNKTNLNSMTTAVMQSRAPNYFDFFNIDEFDIHSAKNGETVFNQHCARCHGTYEKKWSQRSGNENSRDYLTKTGVVTYPQPTVVRDVGTDPLRYQAGKFLAETVMKNPVIVQNNILLSPTSGYIPPPLEGVWATWPYLHNGSVPTLCDLLKPAAERRKVFYVGRAKDKETDFDQECNGYPEDAPDSWQNPNRLYDVSKSSMSNVGHDVGIIIDENGRDLISDQEKRDLILFLKTL